MKRRQFLTAAGLASLAPLQQMAIHTHADPLESNPQAGPLATPPMSDSPQIIELRRYTMPLGRDQQRLHGFAEDVLVPAYNRLDVRPIGVFTVLYGQTAPTLYVLLPHASMDAFSTSRARLFEDDAFSAAVDTAMDEAHYVRYDSDLMRAFEGMPTVEVPDTSQPRIFELRTYESHNLEKARRKIEMFDRGEIDIFRATNLTPVFFGETLVGERLPNLTYMITHPDMSARDAHWAAFVNHPDWKSMSGDPYYADTVSNISNVILRPTGYSQI